LSNDNVVVQQQSTEQQAALIARADKGTDVQTPPPAQNTSLIFGKYKSMEEAEKGYKELEKQFHSSRSATPTPAAQAPASAPAPSPAPAPAASDIGDGLTVQKPTEVQSVLKQAGIDFDALSSEYVANGKLSDANIATLEKAGFPKAVVDQYLTGVKASAQAMIAEYHAVVGGTEQFNAFKAWAGTNLSNAQLEAYNAAAKTGGETFKLTLGGLYQQYKTSTGSEPNLVGGGNASAGSVDVFNSMGELKAAINDPRYGKDRAYTLAVEQKVARSNKL
jgi:hypothetical protein